MNRGFLALVLGLAACGGSGTAHVVLGARAGTAASTAATAPDQRAQPLDLKNGIIVTRLRIVLSEVKLETGPGSGEVEMKAAPLLIDLLQRDPYHFDALITLGFERLGGLRIWVKQSSAPADRGR